MFVLSSFPISGPFREIHRLGEGVHRVGRYRFRVVGGRARRHDRASVRGLLARTREEGGDRGSPETAAEAVPHTADGPGRVGALGSGGEAAVVVAATSKRCRWRRGNDAVRSVARVELSRRGGRLGAELVTQPPDLTKPVPPRADRVTALAILPHG